jgi:hypothetical protein
MPFPTVAIIALSATAVYAAWSGTVSGTGLAKAASDIRAPQVSESVIAESAAGAPAGDVHAGGTYFIYANVTDAGSPASGAKTVTADVSALTAGATSVVLASCASSCTVGATTYNRKSAAQTVGAVPSGTSYSVSATDFAGNSKTYTGFAVTVDAQPASASISFPAASAFYASASWNAGCTDATADICGAASDDASGVASVAVSIQQAASPSLYWNGASFASATEVRVAATGTTSWSYAMAVPPAGGYKVRAYAMDKLGQAQSTATLVTFSIDSTIPTSTMTFPGAGPYNVGTWTTSGTSCASATICGTASDTGGSGVARVDVSVLQAATSKYWDGVGFNSATQVFVPATGTTSWSLAFAAANFPADGSYTVSSRTVDGAGNNSTVASATFTMNASPHPKTLAMADATASDGKPEQGDSITLTFSEALAESSICSKWSGTNNQTEAGNNDVTVSILNDAASSGNDELLVSIVTSKCSPLRYGTVDLGSKNYVSGDVTYAGSGANASKLEWIAASNQVRITFGQVSAAANVCSATCPTSSTAIYVPDTGLTDTTSPTGQQITGSASLTGLLF